MARPASYSALFSVSSNSFQNEAQVETRFAAPFIHGTRLSGCRYSSQGKSP